MRLIHQVFVFGILVGFANSGLWANPETKDGLAEKIAQLPWDAVVNEHAIASDAQIVIVAHYVKPNVVDDAETRYVAVHPVKKVIDKNGNLTVTMNGRWMESKCRDGAESWCNGSGEISKADKNGFDYHLSLAWGREKEGNTKFDETFHCLWLKEQTFTKDGLTMTITVKLK